jgi:hypothetical protein
MTRRERLERKIEKREEWAAGRREKSAALREIGKEYRHDWAFITQPGHIPARAAMNRRDDKAHEHDAMAAHHDSKAAGLAAQLDRSVFSDDADAVEQLEARIAEHEATRDRMKLVNKLYAKGDAAGLAAIGLDLDALKAKLAAAGPYWGSKPHLPYELTNLGARIRADRERIEDIRRRKARAEQGRERGRCADRDAARLARLVSRDVRRETRPRGAGRAQGCGVSVGFWPLGRRVREAARGAQEVNGRGRGRPALRTPSRPLTTQSTGEDGMAESKFRTVLSGTFSWNGGPPQPVEVEIRHAPELAGANDRRCPTPHGSYRAPEALTVPPPPDYSTPYQASMRAWEAAGKGFGYEVWALAQKPGTFTAFRKAVEKAGGALAFATDVRDTHASKWTVTESAEWAEWKRNRSPYGRRDSDSPEPARYTLTLASDVAPAPVKSRKPRAKRDAA